MSGSDSLLAGLAELDPAVLTDVDKSLRVMDPGLRPARSGLRLLGRARTVRCFEDFLTVMAAVADAGPGEVLVVDTQGSRRAVLGELFSVEAARRGLAGIVVDGGCRDSSTLQTLEIPVWCRFRSPLAGTAVRLYETQVPVVCGGVPVHPGEIVFGDDDGIVVASDAEISAVIESAAAIRSHERAALNHMASGGSLFDRLNFDEHRARVESGDAASRLQFIE